MEKVEEQGFLTGARKRLIESFVSVNLSFSASALSFNFGFRLLVRRELPSMAL
jgi:hypothetical protein